MWELGEVVITRVKQKLEKKKTLATWLLWLTDVQLLHPGVDISGMRPQVLKFDVSHNEALFAAACQKPAPT